MPRKRTKDRSDPDYKLGGITGKGFFPGKSGNPDGRPKSKLLSEAYRTKLAELVPGDKDGRTYAELICDKMIENAAKGKVIHASEVADRVEGKPRQAYEVAVSAIEELADRMRKARARAKK